MSTAANDLFADGPDRQGVIDERVDVRREVHRIRVALGALALEPMLFRNRSSATCRGSHPPRCSARAAT